MDIYILTSLILTLTVGLAYTNYRLIKLPTTIAVMAGAVAISLVILTLKKFGYSVVSNYSLSLLQKIDFHTLLMKGMLGFLLFAGSLTIDFEMLRSEKVLIGLLASFGVIASTLLIAVTLYYLLPLLHLSLPFLYCLLFGALISPTDPIAVLATFKTLKTNKALTTIVAGESLFNDGVGVVIFIVIFQLAFNHQPITLSNVSSLFAQQALGGILYGAILGYCANRLILQSSASLAILITLVIVTAGYTLANSLGLSGPLAMVVAGIFIGNKARKGSHSDKINTALEIFWELIDDVLNTILFTLVGFELLAIHTNWNQLIAAFLCVPLTLLVRLITVALPAMLLKRHRRPIPGLITTLTWGGLRGGLAVALCLSLPEGPHREFILTLTFSVVAFAVIAQGLTVGKCVPQYPQKTE